MYEDLELFASLVDGELESALSIGAASFVGVRLITIQE